MEGRKGNGGKEGEWREERRLSSGAESSWQKCDSAGLRLRQDPKPPGWLVRPSWAAARRPSTATATVRSRAEVMLPGDDPECSLR